MPGEYHIACLLSAPEGFYQPSGAGLSWQAPSGGAHLRVIVRDGSDGRVVPELTVRATVLGSGGEQAKPVALPFGWYPLLNGYGENISLPGHSSFTIRVEIDPPDFHRHDPYNGDRFTKPTVAEFAGLHLPGGGLGASLGNRESAQLALAKKQGDAFQETLDEMFQQATDGAQKQVGDYVVAVAVEYAEAWWFYRDPQHFDYKYEEETSAKHNSHIEIAPRDARTGRFLPTGNVRATLRGPDGVSLGTVREHFMWHPWLYHYGDNWRVPAGGKYQIVARFEPPPYRRYGRAAGRRFARPVEVAFDQVEIKTGEK